jgi:hypothetical protein
MRRRFAFAFLLVCAVLASALVGCLSTDPAGAGSWGGGTSGSGVHSTDRDADSSVVHITHNDRIELLLLIEGSSNSGTRIGPPAGGTILLPTGRVANWESTVRRSKLQELRIDGAAFPLEAGGVFYIDVRNGQTLVQQLPLDPNEIASGKGEIRENIKASAGKHPVIAGFCTRCYP